MREKNFLLATLTIFFLLTSIGFSTKSDYFSQGKILFEKKKFLTYFFFNSQFKLEQNREIE